MRHRKQIATGLFVVSLVFFTLQAGLWVHSMSSAHTETDKQNIEGHQPPTLLPALSGFLLLIAAATVASLPQRVSHKRHSWGRP